MASQLVNLRRTLTWGDFGNPRPGPDPDPGVVGTAARNPMQQRRWDGFIQSAFTVPRNPPVSAPDGTPYKTPLLDCLRGGGVTL